MGAKPAGELHIRRQRRHWRWLGFRYGSSAAEFPLLGVQARRPRAKNFSDGRGRALNRARLAETAAAVLGPDLQRRRRGGGLRPNTPISNGRLCGAAFFFLVSLLRAFAPLYFYLLLDESRQATPAELVQGAPQRLPVLAHGRKGNLLVGLELVWGEVPVLANGRQAARTTPLSSGTLRQPKASATWSKQVALRSRNTRRSRRFARVACDRARPELLGGS